MTAGNRKENIADEIKEAEEHLAAAEILRSSGMLKDAVSRAYYAAYHAARAMLLTEALEPKTHRGLREMFRDRFTGEGGIAVEDAARLDRLETARIGADYGRGYSFSSEEAIAFVADARAVLNAVTAELRAHGWIA